MKNETEKPGPTNEQGLDFVCQRLMIAAFRIWGGGGQAWSPGENVGGGGDPMYAIYPHEGDYGVMGEPEEWHVVHADTSTVVGGVHTAMDDALMEAKRMNDTDAEC